MIFPAEAYFVHGVEPITEGIRWSVNSFLGIEGCVYENNKNEYGTDPWYHESTRQYNEKLSKNFQRYNEG